MAQESPANCFLKRKEGFETELFRGISKEPALPALVFLRGASVSGFGRGVDQHLAQGSGVARRGISHLFVDLAGFDQVLQ